MSAVDPFSQTYRCLQNAPLSCDQPQKTSQQVPEAKFCLECGFPATLPDGAEIRGSRGTYRIVGYVRSQGMGRLYKGIQIGNGQPVVIKEYLLPSRCFNSTEARQRKTTFTRVAGVSLADSQGRDFRLVTPSEAIADTSGDRCYLIVPGKVAAAPTLTQVVRENGAMSAAQVRMVLGQVLQTLQFLHSQKLRLPSGQVRPGLAHGNLSLESLLMTENFYVYSCDLASWERIFDPPPTAFSIPEPAQDLIALGHVAFYLWTGRAKVDSSSNRPLDPRNAQHWPMSDPPLREFLYHLLGLETPFTSAEAARQALLQLPNPEGSANAPRAKRKGLDQKRRRHLFRLLGFLVLLLIAGLLWLVWSRFAPAERADFAAFERLVPSFADVNSVQPGTYPYTSERVSTWASTLDKKPASDLSIKDLLAKPRTDIAAEFNYTDYKPQPSPIQAVINENNQANFALMSLVEQLPDTLDSKLVGYDGLVVFVPAYKAQNLPKALQGKINLDQLRQIFTGQITNWRQVGSNLPPLEIKPYRPLEPEALRLFQHIVLNDEPELIAQFQRVEQRSTFETLRAIDLDERQGQPSEAATISFGTLVRTWDQCKVYPLALVKDQQPVQALLRETTAGTLEPITPSDNLCFEKKPFPNVLAHVSKAYPLGYPLVVAYPKDNSSPGYRSGPMFADLLRTQDGQYLLQQAGLVPLQPIPRDYELSQSLLSR